MKLSIITPTLNCADTIAATLASVRPLVAQGAEHLVVDSGSTDGTVEICRHAGARILTHPAGNLYAAVNAGIRASSGEWITYINGDDVLYADSLARRLEAAGGCRGIVYGDILIIDEAGRTLHLWRTAPAGLVHRLLRQVSALHQQGTLISRDAFEALGGFDEAFTLSADYDFFLRASRAGIAFRKIPGPAAAGFRQHAGQLSRQQQNIEIMAREGRLARERRGIRHARWAKLAAILAMKVINLDTIAARPLHALRRRQGPRGAAPV